MIKEATRGLIDKFLAEIMIEERLSPRRVAASESLGPSELSHSTDPSAGPVAERPYPGLSLVEAEIKTLVEAYFGAGTSNAGGMVNEVYAALKEAAADKIVMDDGKTRFDQVEWSEMSGTITQTLLSVIDYKVPRLINQMSAYYADQKTAAGSQYGTEVPPDWPDTAEGLAKMVYDVFFEQLVWRRERYVDLVARLMEHAMTNRDVAAVIMTEGLFYYIESQTKDFARPGGGEWNADIKHAAYYIVQQKAIAYAEDWKVNKPNVTTKDFLFKLRNMLDDWIRAVYLRAEDTQNDMDRLRALNYKMDNFEDYRQARREEYQLANPYQAEDEEKREF